APVGRDVVLKTLAVRDARRIASRDVDQGGAVRMAKFDYVDYADRVNCDRLFQRRFEVHQSCAMDYGIDRIMRERVATLGNEARLGDIAGNDFDFLFELAIEVLAQMFAHRGQCRRIENLAPKAQMARPPIAPDQKIDARDFRMIAQQYRKQHLAQEPGGARDQDTPRAQYLVERRHRSRPAALA